MDGWMDGWMDGCMDDGSKIGGTQKRLKIKAMRELVVGFKVGDESLT